MRFHVSAFVATAALALTAPLWAQHPPNTGGVTPDPNAPDSGHDAFVSDPSHREVTVTGTVVRERSGQMVLRIDDHHHLIPFQVSDSAAAQDVRPGSRVAVTYHPTGEIGQAIDQVQVLEQPRSAHRGHGGERQGTK